MSSTEPPTSPRANAERSGGTDPTDRFASLIGRRVDGSGDLTFEDLMRSVAAARRRTAGTLDVHRFLSESGHPWQTIECVLAYLAFSDDGLAAAAEAQTPPAPFR